MIWLVIGICLIFLITTSKKSSNNTQQSKIFDTQLRVNVTALGGLGFAEGTNLSIRTDKNNLLIEDGIKTIALQYSSITDYSLGNYRLENDGISIGGTIIGATLFGGVGAVVGSKKNKDITVPLLKIDYDGAEAGELILSPVIQNGKINARSNLYSLLEALKMKVDLNETTKII